MDSSIRDSLLADGYDIGAACALLGGPIAPANAARTPERSDPEVLP
jgi:hypothetical protein